MECALNVGGRQPTSSDWKKGGGERWESSALRVVSPFGKPRQRSGPPPCPNEPDERKGDPAEPCQRATPITAPQISDVVQESPWDTLGVVHCRESVTPAWQGKTLAEPGEPWTTCQEPSYSSELLIPTRRKMLMQDSQSSCHIKRVW